MQQLTSLAFSDTKILESNKLTDCQHKGVPKIHTRLLTSLLGSLLFLMVSNWFVQFHRPEPVEIPDRYVPDSSDEDESLTADEKLFRKERADHYKKIIAKQR